MIIYWEKNKEEDKNKNQQLNKMKKMKLNLINLNYIKNSKESIENYYIERTYDSSNFNQSFLTNNSFNLFFNDNINISKKENYSNIENDIYIKFENNNNKTIDDNKNFNFSNENLNNENIDLKIYHKLPTIEKKMFINKNSKFLLISQIGSEFLINIINSERLEIINIILYLIIKKFNIYKNNVFTKNIIKALYKSNNNFILKNLLLCDIGI